MTDLVRVKLENGMEASLPRQHAINSGYKPLEAEGKPAPATDSVGNALPASGAEEAREARKATANVPTKSSSKADWEAHARAQGATDEDLAGKTKDDLIAAYGTEED